MVEFVEWLRQYNNKLDNDKKVGFYGLDLYSMHSSLHAVIDYLRHIDPDAGIKVKLCYSCSNELFLAQRAKKRYSCFDHYGKDPQSYGLKVSMGMNWKIGNILIFPSGTSKGCQQEAVNQLIEMINSASYCIFSNFHN